jgi:hypothetical protein
MECEVGGVASAEVVKLAVDIPEPEADKVPVPSVVAPSLKVTVPVGDPAVTGFAVTVAVNVTD